ncbi:5-methylthioadenosine/S-adenosylhomocysteine deaminase [Porphyridium purpureum]|uniref:5-methylthioadenosine/S-adenosylhomocysteine deaminase n=1 Tax=Porphyridium purpureum TaxID=35688 RepID=A0A5J4Z7U6_PORPP|nr:5-methylthioadenosine/S-adenosylhomocysteine deaminase [Porphyridium purpureum]|eukprot:POR7416..scf295_1
MVRAMHHRDVALVISARYVLPIEPRSDLVLDDHAVVVDTAGRIVELLDRAEAWDKYGAEWPAVGDGGVRSGNGDDVKVEVSSPKCPHIEFVHLPDHALMPGFVNAHTHTGMALMRGMADDEALFAWLQDIWKVEGRFTSQPSFCYDGAYLSAAEMIRNGTTCFADMYWDPDEAVAATTRAGLRALIGLICIGFPSHFAKDEDGYITRGLQTLEKHKHEPLVRFAWSPHAPYTVSDATLKRLSDLSERDNIPYHIHLHETSEECDASEQLNRDSGACHKSDFLGRPVANLERLGILNSRMLAAHMVHLTDDEIQLVAARNVNVVHCPTSNLKLASGFCRTVDLVRAGVNVALGTDSVCSNNSLDIFEEMKMAALLGKTLAKSPSSLPAHIALKMATLNGAIALGMQDLIGSLVPGKMCDMIGVELGTRAGTSPIFNPISTLVYAASHEDVKEVWVGGRRLLRKGKYVDVDMNALLERNRFWTEKINDFRNSQPATTH